MLILRTDLRGLVVRVVPHILRGDVQGRLHSTEEKPEVAAYRGMGTSFVAVFRTSADGAYS